MSKPVSTIRNLGPASEDAFARAGITSAEQVREMGAEAAYARLIAAGTRPHFIGFYALYLGLQGRPWNDLGVDEKKDLRKVFDRIVAESTATPLTGIEAELNALGVVPDTSGQKPDR